MTPTIRVVLVDDQELIRFGIGSLLERDPEITVVAEAEEGRQGLSAVAREVPDVVLMDIRMPEVDGLEATRRIVADPKLADVRMVVLTTFDEDELVLGAIRAGAAGFLLKDTSPDDLRRAIHVVAAGKELLSPSATTGSSQPCARLVAHPKLAGVRAVVLAAFDGDERVVGAIRAGAAGFLLKDTSPDDLRRAIHVVADGKALLSPSATTCIARRRSSGEVS